MTASQFADFVDTLKRRGYSTRTRALAEMLGVSTNTIRNLFERGADKRTALACQAVLDGHRKYTGAKTNDKAV